MITYLKIFLHSLVLFLITETETKINLQPSGMTNSIDFAAIYKSCFPQIRGMVLQNSGTVDDARDVFQEAVMVLYQNSTRENFLLTSNICTYLYSVAHNIWLKQLRKNSRNENSVSMDIADEKLPVDDDYKKQQQRLLINCLSKIGEKCQNILQLYFEGMEGEKIAAQLQFASYEYYRVAKTRCTEKLKSLMQQDKLFKELKS